MTIATKLALLARTKKEMRLRLGLDSSVPFSDYAKLLPYNPAVAFLDGQKGLWYDHSDLTTLFQDAPGTVPITTSGDPLGLIKDKSGNNNHATQTLSASRPTYQTDGTLHWLSFDGVDDLLRTANINMLSATDITICIGLTKTTDPQAAYVLGHSEFGVLAPAYLKKDFSFKHGSFSRKKDLNSLEYPAPATKVLTMRGTKIDGGLISLAVNGTVEKSVPASAEVAGYANYPITIGAGTDGRFPLHAKISQVFIIASKLSAADLLKVEQYIASKSGVTL